MIPAGIPDGRDEWPLGVLDHLRRFEQGHLVRELPFFYFSNPSFPVFGQGRTADDGSPELVWDAEDFQYGMIATQTCDLREEDTKKPKQPWFHCCPVYRVDDPERGLDPGQVGHLKKDRLQHFIWVPDIPEPEGVWAADLRLIVPLEKSWLLGREPVDGFVDESKRPMIGQRLALIHSRPAFDPALVQSVSEPTVAALRNLAKGDPDLYAEISEAVYAIGVRTDRLVEMTLDSVEIFLLCWHEPSDAARSFWESCSEEWSQIALRSGDHRLRPLQFKMLDETSAAELIRLQVVPLTGLTPNPLWYAD